MASKSSQPKYQATKQPYVDVRKIEQAYVRTFRQERGDEPIPLQEFSYVRDIGNLLNELHYSLSQYFTPPGKDAQQKQLQQKTYEHQNPNQVVDNLLGTLLGYDGYNVDYQRIKEAAKNKQSQGNQSPSDPRPKKQKAEVRDEFNDDQTDVMRSLGIQGLESLVRGTGQGLEYALPADPAGKYRREAESITRSLLEHRTEEVMTQPNTASAAQQYRRKMMERGFNTLTVK